MALKTLQRQGELLVVRDATTGRVLRNDDGTHKAAPRPKSKETWRSSVLRLTNNGRDIHEALLRLAMGQVEYLAGTTPEGTKIHSEPQVPSPEVRRAALKDLHEMLHGKAVAETELIRAEQAQEDMLQYRAMSDEQLQRIIDGEFERLDDGEQDA